MNLASARDKFQELIEQMQTYHYAISLMNWDVSTASPKKGKPYAAKAIGALSSQLYSLRTKPDTQEILASLQSNSAELTTVEKRQIELMQKEAAELERIPPAEYQAYCELTATAKFVWEQAKAQDDFHCFAPYLEEIFAYTKRFSALRKPDMPPYDACLDNYEDGLTMKLLDPFFEAVRTRTIPLLSRIVDSGIEISDPLAGNCFPREKQLTFAQRLLDYLGFDREAGLLAESVHPFTSGINRGDVRLTTAVHETMPISSIFSTIHEAGHGLYEQHARISPIIADSMLISGVSMGIHESQSRFYENILGRSLSFWEYLYPSLLQVFPKELDGVSLESFFRYINRAQPNLIRIEADELTYNLHIMIRYELEKALLSGDIQVSDLPDVWSEKYQAYLGITPDRHGLGVLQDVHWSGGMIGYFPSYSLGNAYAAQFANTMSKTLNIEALCKAGDLTPINDWLNTNIHQYGMLKKPGELLMDITGQPLNPDYLMTYLEQKYNAIYFA